MIKHIWKLIWNQRKSNSWLLGELLLVAVCLWYVVDYFLISLYAFNTPLGFDIGHVYNFQFNSREETSEGYLPPEEHPTSTGEDVWEAVARLRRHPAVEAVAVSRYSVPYTTIDNYISLSRDTTSAAVNCRLYIVSPEYFELYDIPFDEGDRAKLPDEFNGINIIISRDATAKLFQDGPALKQEVYLNNSEVARIGGITATARPSEFRRTTPRIYVAMSESDIKQYPANMLPWLEVSVRVKPGADQDFADSFMRKESNRLETGNLYLQSITPVSTIRQDNLREEKSDMNMRLSILFFLLINIFLGIVGTFWFRTRHRQGEMGLRLALGSTRRELKRVIIGEGLLLLVIAIVPALLICANLMFLDVTDAALLSNSFPRFLAGISATCLLMALMIIAGIWYPAAEAARTEPAESLHYE